MEHTYILSGSQVVGEQWSIGKQLLYIHDENGSVIGLGYRETSYAAGDYDYFFFDKNIFGDIIAIYNESGECIGTYIYDAWGNFETNTATGNTELETLILTTYNPFRYRGYYYDVETGLYYLQSRYYNPEWGRFLNADAVMSDVGGDLRGYNLFAYCFNNPITLQDHNGQWPSLKEIGNWISDTWDQASTFVSKTADIIFTKEFAENIDDIILKNVEADIGLCFGIGLERSFGEIGVEAISRIDIVGLQLKDGKLHTGHDGRSTFAVNFAFITVGPQNDTYEPWGGGKQEHEATCFDFGFSYGKAAAFLMGYHCNVSVSFSGMLTDTISYVKERW